MTTGTQELELKLTGRGGAPNHAFRYRGGRELLESATGRATGAHPSMTVDAGGPCVGHLVG